MEAKSKRLALIMINGAEIQIDCKNQCAALLQICKLGLECTL